MIWFDIIVLENGKNKGILYTKTQAILHAKGKYVMTMDEDDIYVQRDAFSLLYNEAEKNNLDILGFIFIHSGKKMLRKRNNGKKFFKVFRIVEYFRRRLTIGKAEEKNTESDKNSLKPKIFIKKLFCLILIVLVIILLSLIYNNSIEKNSLEERKCIQNYMDLVFNGTKIDKDKIYYPSINPKISIIISVYNGEAFLRTALLSIQNQIFKDIEIIMIDDGSEDNSVNLIKELMKTEPRIILT